MQPMIPWAAAQLAQQRDRELSAAAEKARLRAEGRPTAGIVQGPGRLAHGIPIRRGLGNRFSSWLARVGRAGADSFAAPIPPRQPPSLNFSGDDSRCPCQP